MTSPTQVRALRRLVDSLARLCQEASRLQALSDPVLAATLLGRRGRHFGSAGIPLALCHVPLQKLEEREGGEVLPVDRFTLVPLKDILYFFTCAATRKVIHAAWARQIRLPSGVYARTAQGLFLFPRYRSLGALRRELRLHKLVSIHESLLVNVDRVAVTDRTPGRENLVGLDAGGAVEFLQASRREFMRFRRVFAFPLRRSSSPAPRARRPDTSQATESSTSRPDRGSAAHGARTRMRLPGTSES